MFLGAGSGGVGNGSFPVSGTSVSVNANPRGPRGRGLERRRRAGHRGREQLDHREDHEPAHGQGRRHVQRRRHVGREHEGVGDRARRLRRRPGADLAVLNNGTNTATVWRIGLHRERGGRGERARGRRDWIATQQRDHVDAHAERGARASSSCRATAARRWQRLATNVPGTLDVDRRGRGEQQCARCAWWTRRASRSWARARRRSRSFPRRRWVSDGAAARFGVRRVVEPARGAVTVTFALPLGGAHSDARADRPRGPSRRDARPVGARRGRAAVTLAEGASLRPACTSCVLHVRASERREGRDPALGKCRSRGGVRRIPPGAASGSGLQPMTLGRVRLPTRRGDFVSLRIGRRWRWGSP